MRKLMMVVALVVVMVPLLAGVAFAFDQVIQCRSIPCYGSKNPDKILERIGNGKSDKIIARGGQDLVRANTYTNDIDVVKSGGGIDTVNVADGDNFDKAKPGRAENKCIVDVRREAGAGCDKVVIR